MSHSQHSETVAEQPRKSSGAGLIKRLAPLAVLVLGTAAFFAFGLDDYVSFETLREHRHFLMTFVEQQGLVAVAVFVVAYAVSTALSLPGGALLSVTGGFLFGSLFGAFWIVIGATIGATAVFLAAKTALGDALRRRAGAFLLKMEAGFKENAFSYMLVLRLVPLFPFFIVNLVPAFLGVSLRIYVIATFIGIIPGAFVFATVGAGLGSVFDANESFSLSGVLTPQVIAALVGLSLLSLLPIVFKKFKAARSPA